MHLVPPPSMVQNGHGDSALVVTSSTKVAAAARAARVVGRSSSSASRIDRGRSWSGTLWLNEFSVRRTRCQTWMYSANRLPQRGARGRDHIGPQCAPGTIARLSTPRNRVNRSRASPRLRILRATG